MNNQGNLFEVSICNGDYVVEEGGKVWSVRSKKYLKPDIDKDGYEIYNLSINKKGKKFKAHRLVYFSFNPCEDKTLQINHIDKDKRNNSLSNLELVSLRENNTHRFLNKKTSSKYRGVTWCERDKTWRAQIQVNKVKKHIGLFKCETAAYFAYMKSLKEHNLQNKYA